MLTSTDEALASVGCYVVVGEGKQVQLEFALTHNTSAWMVPPIALTPMMSDEERLWFTVDG